MFNGRVYRMFPETGRVAVGGGGAGLLPEMSRLVDSVFAGMPEPRQGAAAAGGSGGGAFPAIDAIETAEAIELYAQLPGYAIDDLSITMEGPELTIAGSEQKWTLPEGATVLRRERAESAGRAAFTRTVRVGVPIDAERVSARLEAGILRVSLPKAEVAKPRKIEVKGG